MGSNTSIYEPVDDNNYVLNSITPIDNSSSRSVHFTDESFDSFTLIWLDVQSKGNDLESLKTKNLLLQICKDCLFYENCDLFFNDINQRKFANKKALLIVSGSFVNIISTYNVRNNISAAIIFCRYRYNYEHLRDTFIVDICTDRKSLKNSITYEMSSLKLNLFENQPLKSVQSLTENNINNGVYYKYLLFIELLKQMPQTDQAKETMLKKSEDYYRTQEASLKQIDEFRQSYTFDKALRWYTRDTFVYRLVNLAFRTEDITLWYIFRFYITDLCRQLEKIYREQEENFGHRRLILYRGQSRISTKELEDIKSSIGGLVATTGFFSTSFDEEVAGKFVLGASTTHDYAPVFFEIVVDTNNTKNLIFADVFKSLSAQKESNTLVAGEREILFNIGSVFKITNVYYHTNKSLWYITMEGTDEGTSLVKNQIKLIIEKFQIQNMNLLFGKHILNMGYYSAAECYFQQMLQELPKNHKDIPLIYHFIGDIKMRITNWNEALTNFNRAYMLKRKSHSGKHPDFAITWNNIGNYHIAIGNYDLALLSYQNSLKYVKDSFNIAITKLNIASILIMNGQYLQALEVCRESLCLLQQIEPCPKGEFVRCHGLIGDIHHAQQEYDDAEASYLCAFAIAKKYLLMDDRRLIKCIEALAIMYQKQDSNNNNRSIDFCREYLLLYQKDLPENHISIAYILMILGKLSDKIDYYERALSIFEKTISQEYASTANCLMLVAKYYDEQKLYEKALSFYMRAYEIQTKIYPLNHSLIVESSKILSVIERKLKRQPTK
jgi:tetratricopeptide (TPR) repeat protein